MYINVLINEKRLFWEKYNLPKDKTGFEDWFIVLNEYSQDLLLKFNHSVPACMKVFPINRGASQLNGMTISACLIVRHMCFTNIIVFFSSNKT